MNRQHPWPHAIGNRILILITVSEICEHCQNFLDNPHILNGVYTVYRVNGSLQEVGQVRSRTRHKHHVVTHGYLSDVKQDH